MQRERKRNALRPGVAKRSCLPTTKHSLPAREGPGGDTAGLPMPCDLMGAVIPPRLHLELGAMCIIHGGLGCAARLGARLLEIGQM